MHYMYQAMCARHVPSCVNISCAQAQLNNIFAHNIMNDNADFLVFAFMQIFVYLLIRASQYSSGGIYFT